MRKYAVLIAALAALVVASAAGAALSPGTFDPDGTGACAATWDAATQTLVLEKNGPTSTNCAAGADITGFSGATLTGLSFTFSEGSHCGAGSPRFDVLFSDGSFRIFTCQYGDWSFNEDGSTTVTFSDSTPYCDFASSEPSGCFQPSDGAVIDSIDILLDEQGAADLSAITVNGEVQVPEPVVVPTADTGGPPNTFLCYSHIAGSIPTGVNFSAVGLRLAQGWFLPSAVSGNDPTGDNLGAYHLVCNTAGLKATGTGIGGEGDFFDADAWRAVLAYYGPTPINHYELYK